MIMLDSEKLFPENAVVGAKEASQLLNVGISTIGRWVDVGQIPAYKTVGGHRRILLSDLRDFADRTGLPFYGENITEQLTVVVVDDEEDICTNLAIRIRGIRPDISVFTASDALQAGILISRYQPQLIFLDIRMPGVDGIEACRFIRKTQKANSIRIIGITGSKKQSEIEELLDAGAEEVLTKPLDGERINEIVASVFSEGVTTEVAV